MAFFVELAGQTIRAALGGSEHDGLIERHVAQKVIEQFRFVAAVIDIMQALFDIFVTRFLRRHFNQLGAFQQALAELPNATVERGGKQQRLTRGRRGGGDHLDRLDKAHVEHTVGLVQHQQFQARKIHLALLHEINQTARCRHQDVERAVEQLALLRVRHAAQHGAGAHRPRAFAVFEHGIGDLQCQLTRRRQHQHARAAARLGRVGEQALQRGQHKGGGFAGAGGGRNHQVVAGDGLGYCLRLHGGRFGITRGGNGLRDGGIQIQGFK